MYGTVEDIKDALPKLAPKIKDDADPLAIPPEQVEKILTEMTERVNASLGSRYTVPFEAGKVPPIIEAIVVDLAAVKLAQRYLTNITSEENMNLLALRKDAKELLAQLSSGNSSIPGVAPILTAPPAETLWTADDAPYFDFEDPASWQTKL